MKLGSRRSQFIQNLRGFSRRIRVFCALWIMLVIFISIIVGFTIVNAHSVADALAYGYMAPFVDDCDAVGRFRECLVATTEEQLGSIANSLQVKCAPRQWPAVDLSLAAPAVTMASPQRVVLCQRLLVSTGLLHVLDTPAWKFQGNVP